MVLVKTLNGGTFDVVLPDGATVDALVAALRELDPALCKCAVFWLGVALKAGATLPALPYGGFLVRACCVHARGAARCRAHAVTSAPIAVPSSPTAASVSCAADRSAPWETPSQQAHAYTHCASCCKRRFCSRGLGTACTAGGRLAAPARTPSRFAVAGVPAATQPFPPEATAFQAFRTWG